MPTVESPRLRLGPARPLLLASASPRRREILATLGVPTHVAPAYAVDEAVAKGEDAGAYLDRVVKAKLAAAGRFFERASWSLEDTMPGVIVPVTPAAILVADTSVIDQGEILGKPETREDGRAMIGRLAGRTHEVWTRFSLGSPDASPRELHAETVKTRVTFRALTMERAAAYAESGEGDDKAGAYAVQGRGAALVARIEGSYTNVVGLPACELAIALEELGLLP